MDPFSKVSRHYKTFDILVNTDTALGFKSGSLITFQEYSLRDRFIIPEGIVAVVRRESRQIEIGQTFYSSPLSGQVIKCDDPKRKEKQPYIRLWNNQYGEYHRDFDIMGRMLRPSTESWGIRFKEENGGMRPCCPRRGCEPCKSITPCSLDCPFLMPLDSAAAEEKMKRLKKEKFLSCLSTTKPDCLKWKRGAKERERRADSLWEACIESRKRKEEERRLWREGN